MSEIRFGASLFPSMLERQILGKQTQASKPEQSSISPSISSAGESSGSFLETLKQAVGEVNEMQKQADSAAKDFAAGKGSLHETMIAMEKADVALRTVTAVRGKLIEAYQELMRMPV